MQPQTNSLIRDREDSLPHPTHSYQLLVSQVPRHRTLEHQEHEESNIFKANLPMYIGEERESRPIGGRALLKRMDLIQEYKKRKVSRGKFKLLEAIDITSRGKDRKRVKTELTVTTNKPSQKRSKSTFEIAQETLKSHHSNSYQTISHNQAHHRPKRATPPQTKHYLDKTALTGEMSYNHNMVEHAGQRYFEMTLRDRWKDELNVQQYVYLLKPGQPFSNSKIIQQLRSIYEIYAEYRPDIKERQMLLLHGRKIKPDS